MEDEQSKKKSSAAGKLGYAAYKVTDGIMDGIASVARFILKFFGSAVIVLLLAGMLFACIFAYYVKNFLVSEVDVSLSDYTINQASTIWYNDGSGEYKELVTLTGLETHDWVEYEQIPHYMEQAVVAIEDKRFYDHKGVDWYRTSGALIDMFFTMRKTYGGSTITQQVLKNVTGNDEVTVQRKLKEIFGALELEKRYDKKEIMEWYLNVAYFGEGCWGVQRAAQKYFGKDVSELSLAECASIAGITNLPTYYDPFYNEENNKRRQETILREMYNQGFLTYEEYKQSEAEQLYFARTPE
ncbi:MAG: transglycosylase domain-containing protein [Oscillospiraceae bacterium]|nr:transglycosylase domain-containing protein [Oscillospiraceae bacterium]